MRSLSESPRGLKRPLEPSKKRKKRRKFPQRSLKEEEDIDPSTSTEE